MSTGLLTKKKRSQGSQANRSGQMAEQTICSILHLRGYTFTRQAYVGSSIYDHPLRADILVATGPEFPNGFVIESKWQDQGGSVDEKFPYLVMNIKERSPYPTVIVYGGGGAKPGAIAWLRRQVGGNLLAVLSLEEFLSWANRNL